MFIDRLNEALQKKKITGNALCKKLNMPNANYTNWKKQTPKGETLKQIADILNVSTDWLLEREGASTPEEEKLLCDYKDADQRGKETIINIADLEARRSRAKKEQPEELQNNVGKKINFAEISSRQNRNFQKQEDDDELKPFA
ncbi:MAG: helix-turn-helix domain-containing protein [Lachnospiraceae bacterium]|nr:helix-turn-helix domain-containing protein [Lachnospiraceae bacterium]